MNARREGMLRRIGTAVWVVLEATLVGVGAVAIAAAVSDPPGWPAWLAWAPADPLPAALVCLTGGVVLVAVWVLRRRHLDPGRAVLLAGVEAALVGAGAVAITAATADPPAWPGWLRWMPVPPVPTAITTIGAGIVLAVLRALPERSTSQVRRLWAMERPDPGDIDRPELTGRVRRRLVAADGGTVGLTTALVGVGGFGKTTLARLLCADRRVRRRFYSGVWVTLGQDVGGGALADRINDVCERLTGVRPGYTDPDLAGHHLGELLDRSGRVLLVVDDVWRAQQLRPFLHAGRRATRLVTTRRPDVLPVAAREDGVKVDQLEPSQARAVLVHELPPIREAELARLLKLTGGWSLLLRLANAHLRTVTGAGMDPDNAAVRLADRLDREGPDTLSVTEQASRDKAVAANINASLDLLAPTATDPVDGRAFFLRLAVFAEDSDIDRTMLLTLWGADGLTEGHVDRLCERLAGLSLVADYLPGRALRLHDVIRADLRARTRDQLPGLHAALVDGAHTLLPASDGGDGAGVVAAA
jgi:hypothetical protein